VLEGSVRRVGSQVRVNTQLIDAESDTHLWAQRFDRDAGDLFAVQDEITGRIAIALDLEMVAAEAARPAAHPDALDCILRGRAAKSAEQLAARAVAALPRSPLAHFAKGQVLRVRGRYAEAIHEYETVLALNRNWVAALAHIGRCKIFLGLLEEAMAILAQEEAIRLSPRDPSIWNWYFRIGQACLLQSRIDQAVAWLEKARSAQSGAAVPSPLSSLRLCPQGRQRARHRRTPGSTPAE
jgi:tetratricopeptide (TPR) repeat protein